MRAGVKGPVHKQERAAFEGGAWVVVTACGLRLAWARWHRLCCPGWTFVTCGACRAVRERGRIECH